MKVLTWTKQPDSSYHAMSGNDIFRIVLKPRPVDRYVIYANKQLQCAFDGTPVGTPLLFWYLREAKQHCQELANGNTGFTQNTGKRKITDVTPQANVPFPSKDQVIIAVRAVTSTEGRAWLIVDEAWKVLTASDTIPSVQTIASLEVYVLEIAKWGSLRRWLTEIDLSSAALALWDLRDKVIMLHGKNYYEAGVAEAVANLYIELIERMRERGIAKAHYSWASKILHWLLPSCAPVYDSLVLKELQIIASGPQAYQQIIAWEYDCAESLQLFANEVLGDIREMTLLAAIDNYLWWIGKQR